MKNTFWVKNKKFIGYLGVFSIINSLVNLAILFFLSKILQIRSLSDLGNYFWLQYVMLIVVGFVLNKTIQKQILKYSHNKLFHYESQIFKTLKSLSLRDLEKIGSEKIYSVFEELRNFIYLPGVLINILSSVSVILICLAYLFFLSTKFALIIIISMALFISIYLLTNKKNFKRVEKVSQFNETFFKLVNDILQGFKELKLSAIKKNNLFNNYLGENRKNARSLEIQTINNFLTTNLFAYYGLYMIFGVVVFILPLISQIPLEKVISFVLVILFMASPINNLFAMQQIVSKLVVGKNKIQNFLEILETTNVKSKSTIVSKDYDFSTIQFKDVIYNQKDNDNNILFTLGPVNVSFNKGETVFIIGGNGSGKSTFINLLTNMYEPHSGNILIDGELIENDDQSYRNLMTSIYTDPYLFSQNYEDFELKNNSKYMELIEIMQLQKVIKDDDEMSIQRKFSKGQTKRLAMILALLEERPILILDEWAADQDPQFREYFYHYFLPMLKEQGKTIIAVTHDDTYFKFADRIIKFESGRIVKQISVATQLKEIVQFN